MVRLALGFLMLALTFDVSADTFRVPELTGPVVDQAGMLRSDTRSALEGFLRELQARGGAQIQVATVADLGGISIEEAAIKITDQWKIGKKKEDRGLLLLVAPNDHHVRIEVGLGLQGDVPDITANRIIQEVIIPGMKEGSPDRAIIRGVGAIAHYTDPKLIEQIQSAPRVHQRNQPLHGWMGYLVWILVFLILIWPRRGRPGWGGGGYWGGFGGGGGGFGGGGGSWSGGGGSFNGGGASGSW